MSRKRIYLDHSATTPTDPRVLEVMLPYFSEVYGNPMATHQFGRKAEHAVEDAREMIASILNCQPNEVVFTSCGSESDNLAIRGVVLSQGFRGQHVITTPIEHPAVTNTLSQLSQIMDVASTAVAVDQYGMVDLDAYMSAFTDQTTLASVMYANNEIGTIQPITKLADIAHEHGVLFHTDAVQAVGQLSLDVQALGVDMLSISAHKFYGPKGVGALFVRDGIQLSPSQTGGNHEDGRRSGTHNTPLIVGMAKALSLAYGEQEARIAHYRAMTSALCEGVLRLVPNAMVTGHPEERLASHISFVFPGTDANKLLMHLDLKGIAASSASACKTGNPEPSTTLLAMGFDTDQARSGLRFTVGTSTTLDDIEYAAECVADAVLKVATI